MSEPSSAIGCIFAVFAVISALVLQVVFAGALYATIPVLGVILALIIWERDRKSAITLVVTSILVLIFALYAASVGLETKLWDTVRPQIIGAYALVIAVELSIYALRVNSEVPAHRKAGKPALVTALVSIAAGLLLAYLTA